MAALSYQVKIAGSDRADYVSTTIADSSRLVVTWVFDEWEIISDCKAISEYNNRLNDNEEAVARIVGLTIECCDDDVDGSTSSTNTNKQVATLQLCCGSYAILIQLHHLEEIPSCLKSLLANERDFVFVGVGVREACAKLERDYGLKCKSMIELAPMASRVRGKSHFFDLNLEELANEITEINIVRPTIPSLSHWGARDLRNEQIDYAITKAYASYSIGKKLMKRY